MYLIGDTCPYGIVTVKSNRLHCLICSNECPHSHYVNDCLELDQPPEVLDTIISILSAPTRTTKSTSPAGVSWKKNTFEIPEQIQRVLRNGVVRSFQSTVDGEIILPCESATTMCMTCKSDLCVEDIKLPLVTEQRVFTSVGRKHVSMFCID